MIDAAKTGSIVPSELIRDVHSVAFLWEDGKCIVSTWLDLVDGRTGAQRYTLGAAVGQAPITYID